MYFNAYGTWSRFIQSYHSQISGLHKMSQNKVENKFKRVWMGPCVVREGWFWTGPGNGHIAHPNKQADIQDW